jgi:hypothetical protein
LTGKFIYPLLSLFLLIYQPLLIAEELIYGKYQSKKELQSLAKQGDDEAKYFLALSLEWGRYSFEEDKKTALRLFKESAENNYGESQYRLYLAYKNGLVGVKIDKKQSKIWFYKALNNEHPSALSEMGSFYWFGEYKEYPKNYKKAVEWYKKAAEKGDAYSYDALADAYLYGEGVEKNKKKSIKYRFKAAELGNSFAQNNLGIMYSEGDGVSKNIEKAIFWYKKASKNLHLKADFNLGKLFQFDLEDFEKAAYWYQKAIDRYNDEANAYLGLLYATGKGVEKDLKKAYELFQNGANDGDIQAQARLAQSYYYGSGVPKNYLKAAKWYRKSAEEGVIIAQFRLGYMLYKGLGVEKDIIESYFWFNLAASSGNEDAKTNIIVLEKEMSVEQVDHAQNYDYENRDNKKIVESKEKLYSGKIRPKGTGFRVSKAGHILTNQHVIDKCKKVFVNHKQILVLASDNVNDLALLQGESSSSVSYFRSGRAIGLGESVVVTGYPLRGILGDGLNVSEGIVSALSGMDNDSRHLQISAAVNAGNSGGPLHDEKGLIVGIIVSKINAVKSAKVLGDVVQGANFAIKQSTALSFLGANSVNYAFNEKSKKINISKIAEAAKKYTVLIECQ